MIYGSDFIKKFYKKHFNFNEFFKKHSIPAYRRALLGKGYLQTQIEKNNEELKKQMIKNKTNFGGDTDMQRETEYTIEDLNKDLSLTEAAVKWVKANLPALISETTSSKLEIKDIKIEGVFLDYGILQKMFQTHLAVEYPPANSKNKEYQKQMLEFNKFMLSEFNKYESKVPEKLVRNTVQNMEIYIDNVIPVVLPSNVKLIFNWAVTDPHKLLIEQMPENYRVIVNDAELFKEMIDLSMQKGGKIPPEIGEPYLIKIKEKIALQIPDYYYGLYGFTHILFLTKSLKKLATDFAVHLPVINIFDEFLQTVFKKYFVGSTNKEDEITRKAAIGYSLISNYFDIKDPDIFMRGLLRLLGATDNQVEKIMQLFKELKYKQYNTISMLPIFLKHLGFYTFNHNTFISELLKIFKHYFSQIIVSYPHLVGMMIVSKYPTTSSIPSLVVRNENDNLEQYIAKHYFSF
jgi:hypothetical protein